MTKLVQKRQAVSHYRINISRYYVREFHVLLKTLRIGAIDPWMSYSRFVERGLNPAFGFIDSLGVRLNSLRKRLLAVTDGIQTSALVAQSSATRENTMELKKIAYSVKKLTLFGALVDRLIFVLCIPYYSRSSSSLCN